MSVKTTRRGFLSASAVLIAGASVIACASRSTGTNPVSPTASSEQGVSPTAVPASTAAPTAAGAKPASNTSPVLTAKVQIEVSIWGSWDSLYRKLSDNFEKQTPSVQVNITSAPQATYHDRLLTRFVAHDFPDMAMIVDFEFSRFETPAFLRDLTAYVKDVSEWDISDPGYKWFYPTPAKFFTKAGKIYAMPNEVNPIGLAYNADLFKEAGIPNPHEQWKQGTWT